MSQICMHPHPSWISKTTRHARAILGWFRGHADAPPSWVLANMDAVALVIQEHPSAVMLVDLSFWGAVGAPTKQGVQVARTLEAQGSVFIDYVPDWLLAACGISHPPRSHDCPAAPSKRARLD